MNGKREHLATAPIYDRNRKATPPPPASVVPKEAWTLHQFLASSIACFMMTGITTALDHSGKTGSALTVSFLVLSTCVGLYGLCKYPFGKIWKWIWIPAFLAFMTILGAWMVRPPDSKPDFERGALYPKLAVELYWGTTNGMPRTATFASKDSGVCGVVYENTNSSPIYDLSLVLQRPHNLASNFNRGNFLKTNFLGRHVGHLVFVDVVPTNRIHFSFRVDTRAGATIHAFNYTLTKDAWVHSNNIVDMDTQAVIAEDISPTFATSKPVNIVVEYEPNAIKQP